MMDGLDRGEGPRSARRRAQRARLRRNRVISLVVVLVAVAAIVAAVLFAGRGSGSAAGSPQTGPASAGGSSAVGPSASAAGASASTAAAVTAAASPGGTASPLASPSSSSSPSPAPPLAKPTKKDPLRIYFGGDSLAGMPGVMLQQLGAKNGLADVRTDYVVSSRLTNTEPVDWPAHLRQQMSARRSDVGIFMIGGNDSGMPMLAQGDFTTYPDKKWLDEYRRRVKKITAIMLQSGVKRVYWVGMPVMPSPGESQKMRKLNELFESVAASSPDVVYVDSYDLLSKKSGGFDASLRSGDGVHYTDQGARVVAKAVWEAIKKDWQKP